MRFGIILEGCVYAAFLTWFLRQRPVRDQLRALTIPYRVLLVVLPVAVMVGQVVDHSPWTFPWVSWGMYTESRTGDVQYLEYTAVLVNRGEVPLPVARSFSRLGKKLVWRLKTLEEQGTSDAHDRLLLAMVHKYNREHAENPVQTVRVWQCVVPMNDYHGPASVHRTLSREVTIN